MSRSVSRSYVTRLFEVGTHLKNVFTLKSNSSAPQSLCKGIFVNFCTFNFECSVLKFTNDCESFTKFSFSVSNWSTVFFNCVYFSCKLRFSARASLRVVFNISRSWLSESYSKFNCSCNDCNTFWSSINCWRADFNLFNSLTTCTNKGTQN